MTSNLPPIVKLAERFLVDIEQAASRFPRRHRHSAGDQLRSHAFRIAKRAHRAFLEPDSREAHVRKLRKVIDDTKVVMQLAQRIRAFASLGQFEALYSVLLDLGRQSGGWFRRLTEHPQGQNSAPTKSAPKRAKTLSTRDAQRDWAR